MNVRKFAKPLLGLLVSALFVWLVLRSVSLDDVGAVLARVRPGWLVLALGLFFLGYACRIWRWKLMLQTENPELDWGRCAVPFMASIAANNVLPFRAGDVLRAFGFSRWLGVPSASVLATLLAERLMDLLALLCALGLALALLDRAGTTQNVLPALSTAGAVMTAAAVLLLLLLPGFVERPINALIDLLGRRAPGPAQGVRRQSGLVFSTLRALAHRGRMPVLLAWSLAAWVFEAAVFYAVARSVPDLAAPIAAWLAMPVGTLSTLLPSTPGYIGTFHYFVISATELFGNTAAASAAFALLVHLALWIPATVWGGVSFLYWILRRPVQTDPA